jgi:hypothetical protein
MIILLFRWRTDAQRTAGQLTKVIKLIMTKIEKESLFLKTAPLNCATALLIFWELGQGINLKNFCAPGPFNLTDDERET